MALLPAIAGASAARQTSVFQQSGGSALPQIFIADENARPYVASPRATYRVHWLFVSTSTMAATWKELDLPDAAITPGRAAEMIVSSINLVRAGRMAVRAMQA